MNKKVVKHTSKKFDYAKAPDWYWRYGLHDAFILSALEIDLFPDCKFKNPRRNCLEIYLDSSQALYEKNICKISLYNYKVKTSELKINELENSYWLSDTLTQLPNKKHLLEIKVVTAHVKRKQFAVEFEFAEVERK